MSIKKIIQRCISLTLTFFIAQNAVAEPYAFTQRIVNNIPNIIALTDTGYLLNSTYNPDKQPPNDVSSYQPGIFQILSTDTIFLTNMSYLASNTNPYEPTPLLDQGCKIVSLKVNSYHQVVETVETVAPAGLPVLVHCTCTAVEGDAPGASMIVTLGNGPNTFTCYSAEQG
jgi:hypothetical protein